MCLGAYEYDCVRQLGRPLLEMIHIWRPLKLSNFQDPPPPLSIYVQNSSTPLTLDAQFQTVLLFFDLAHKQCNGIIKGWLHCLMSESKGSFLVNNILMFGSAWCQVMAQNPISFNKKNKCWTPRTFAKPPPPYVW